MKVVINGCYGGFGLSPEATLEVWRRGGPVDCTPVSEYYRGQSDGGHFGKDTELRKWRDYLAGKNKGGLFVTVFTPDESSVLYARDISRTDPTLIAVVEEMGAAANGACAQLRIVEIPDGVDYEISEYDGLEHVAERHRTWS